MTHFDTDVAVVGLGAMGSAALWQLATHGVSAVGFERFEPGHDHGSSHGESRIYRTAYLEGAGYVPLARRSLALWRELQATGDTTLLTECGALTMGLRESSIIRATLKTIGAHDLPHELLDEDQLRARYPGHRISPGEVGIFEREGGLVRPELAIRTMVSRAEELGARAMTNTIIERIEPTSSGVRLSSGEFTCSARHVVVSVGAWLGSMLPDLGLPLRVTRQVPGWYPVERPELFSADHCPIYLRDIGDHARPGDILGSDSSFYGFPTLDGHTVKVSIHYEGPLTDPEKLDPVVRPEELARVKEYINLFLVGVGTEPVRTSVCMYTNTPDHDFLIGSPPGVPQLTVLGGFSGHSFKFAPVMGEIAANLAIEGETRHPIGFLSLARFAGSAAASDRINP